MTTTSITQDLGAGPAACCAPLATPGLSKDQAADTAKLFKALATPTGSGSSTGWPPAPTRSACASSPAPLGLGQPTVSHHLNTLVQAGLLTREQRGTWAS
jgi:ArsR family transcriptional regulator, arsenate/arsenite/antimonite-responsive transcriptional repressor